MKSVPVTRLSNDDLVCELKQSVAHDRTHTARQVALIAEVERRRLYAPAGYPSMFTFCVGELHLPEDAAYKRIQVARVARRHPAVLTALAEGRVDEAGHDLLRQVQDLLGHEVPHSDLAEVFVRALKAYATLLAKQKHAATEHPRVPRRQKPGSRHISAHVKRVVRKRDKGQCTYVNDAGHRCEARSDLEYDHAIEFARGGEATASNIRLRCRAHNQYAAERTYGAAFMQHKREQTADARGASVTAT